MADVDIFLTNIKTGDSLRLPMLPDRVSESGSVEEVTHKLIAIGEVASPRGERLTTYKWEGVFPGEGSSGASYVYDWQDPSAIVELLRQYKREGAILQLMVTGAPINADVYITNFDAEWSGGTGDVEYDIALKEYKQIVVQTTDESGIENAGTQVGTTVETNVTERYFLVKITTPKSGGYSRIYKSASTGSSVLKKLKNGAEVQVTDEKSKQTFGKVKYGKVTGWMLKADLTYSRSKTTTTTTVVTEVTAS